MQLLRSGQMCKAVGPTVLKYTITAQHDTRHLTSDFQIDKTFVQLLFMWE